MPKEIVETEQWKLGAFMEWREKHRYEECPRCHGVGEVGGGFKDIDGPQPCPECQGRKQVTAMTTEPMPEIPPALREHMRRAWWDFVNPESSKELNKDKFLEKE